jgi:hypothetical protein
MSTNSTALSGSSYWNTGNFGVLLQEARASFERGGFRLLDPAVEIVFNEWIADNYNLWSEPPSNKSPVKMKKVLCWKGPKDSILTA